MVGPKEHGSRGSSQIATRSMRLRGRRRVTRGRPPCDRDASHAPAISARMPSNHSPDVPKHRPASTWASLAFPAFRTLWLAGLVSDLGMDARRRRRVADDLAHCVVAHRRASPGGRRRRTVSLGAPGRGSCGHRRSQTPRHRSADLALHMRKLDGVLCGNRQAHPAASHRVCVRDGDRLRARRAALGAADNRGGGSAERPSGSGGARRCVDEPCALLRPGSRRGRPGARRAGGRLRAERAHVPVGDGRARPPATSQGQRVGARRGGRLGAVRAGLRYVRHTKALRAALFRCAASMQCFRGASWPRCSPYTPAASLACHPRGSACSSLAWGSERSSLRGSSLRCERVRPPIDC